MRPASTFTHVGARIDLTSGSPVVTLNLTTQHNITGDEKRHRVGSVVARAHERMSFYKHKKVVMMRYAAETQKGVFHRSGLRSPEAVLTLCSCADHPEIGEVATLAEQ